MVGDDMDKIKIGKTLKFIRMEFEYKQEYIAKMTGIPRSTYAHYEQDISEPTLNNLIKLANLYNCTIDDIVNDTVQTPRTKNVENVEKETSKKVST